jgi:hypothetical protein
MMQSINFLIYGSPTEWLELLILLREGEMCFTFRIKLINILFHYYSV